MAVDRYRKTNRALWDEWTPIHERSAFYDVDSFRQGKTTLHPTELEEVGDVTGKSLLHLQCHFGLDTLSWARQGARVTGVDFSRAAIERARALSDELGIPARFVHSAIEDLADQIGERFDVVFTSYGTITWLQDLHGWGQLIQRHLEPGGLFYIVDTHPFADVFDERPDVGSFEVEYDYFGGEAIEWPVEGSYADRSARVKQRACYVWQHTLGDVVDALLRAGLTLEFLHEFRHCVFQKFPFMTRDEQGLWRLPAEYDRIPLLFSIRARKPAGG